MGKKDKRPMAIGPNDKDPDADMIDAFRAWLSAFVAGRAKIAVDVTPTGWTIGLGPITPAA